MAYRNFIFDSDFDNEATAAAFEKVAKLLADRWNVLNGEIEYDAIMRDESYYDLEEDHVSNFMESANSPEEAEELRRSYFSRKESESEAVRIEMDLIEDQLHKMGARIARRYEHWNEEEGYIEHMETRYDGAGY